MFVKVEEEPACCAHRSTDAVWLCGTGSSSCSRLPPRGTLVTPGRSCSAALSLLPVLSPLACCTLSRPISPSAFLRCPRRPLCTVPVHSLTPSHSVSLIFHWFLVTGTSMCQNSPGVCGGQTSHDRVWEDCARICVSTSRTPWERSLPALPCVPATWAGAGLDLHV